MLTFMSSDFTWFKLGHKLGVASILTFCGNPTKHVEIRKIGRQNVFPSPVRSTSSPTPANLSQLSPSSTFQSKSNALRIYSTWRACVQTRWQPVLKETSLGFNRQLSPQIMPLKCSIELVKHFSMLWSVANEMAREKGCYTQQALGNKRASMG